MQIGYPSWQRVLSQTVTCLQGKNDVSFALFPRSREPVKDGVIATFDEHEDSVYAVEWSTADPWVFASLSYDGRLVINRVPRAEKYKILL